MKIVFSCSCSNKPELCDFYLSSVVQKKNLKIAISTNGKSPTIAKRLKELFNELLPEDLDDMILAGVIKPTDKTLNEQVGIIRDLLKE